MNNYRTQPETPKQEKNPIFRSVHRCDWSSSKKGGMKQDKAEGWDSGEGATYAPSKNIQASSDQLIGWW